MYLDTISADLAVPLQAFTNKAFTHSTHTTKTLIQYIPNQTQQPAGLKSPSSTERVTTNFFRTSINRSTMISHPFDPTLGWPQTVKRHERAITNYP